MSITINKALLKRVRKSKLWSQDELAVASGLGLRTVQRIEGNGTASPQALKALAAALDVNAKSLIQDGETERNYFNMQFGYTTIGVGITILLFITWQLSAGLISPTLFASVTVALGIALSLFSTLTISATPTQLTWHFGLGFWKKRLELDQIKSFRTVINKAWWGWGIRRYEKGWLYNVSGLRAIELVLNDGRHIRIGSDEPDALAAYLELCQGLKAF